MWGTWKESSPPAHNMYYTVNEACLTEISANFHQKKYLLPLYMRSLYLTVLIAKNVVWMET